MTTNKIKVVNIRCGGCEKGITLALNAEGLNNVKVSHEEQTVEFDGDRELGVSILTKLGYPEADTKLAKSSLKKARSYTTCAVGTVAEGVEQESKRGRKFWMLVLLPVVVVLAVIAVAWFALARGGSPAMGVGNVESNPQLRAELRAEFDSAYPQEIVPTGKVVEVALSAGPSEVEIFDGYKTKVWSYNGTVPGPELRIKLGDTLKINFTNNLPQETTIHFHGVRVPNAMDGVPGVTQEPIAPGGSFTYEFTPKDAGSYWYHPHVRTSEQIERGLFGTLVVEDEESAKYSQDKLWVLDDWRMTEDAQVYPYFNTPMDLMHDGRWGNVVTVNGHLQEVLEAKPGERIRLRLVNTSNARIYVPEFGDLHAQVVAVDGLHVRDTFDANGFEISPGNRLDVDITIPPKAGEYIVYDNYTGERIELAKIQVAGSSVVTPDFVVPTNKSLPEWESAVTASIDKEYVLDARRKPGTIGMGMMGQIEWTINGKAYPDYDPVVLKYNEFNKVRFNNVSTRLHPMHLHGQFFKVVARNGKAVDEPYFRDTVLVHPEETVDIALVPMDKGRWVSHCHILEHAESGMLTVVEVK